MSYHIVILLKARLDIREARAWYDNESPGLGNQFWDELYQAFLRIADHPSRFSLADEVAEIRRSKPKRFPYKIYFYTNEAMKRVEIIAVVHKARSSRVWKRRI
ncbi:MAG TPA: type II toxin-antitoxin system RelE/ParE family toxin [Saprospiraceae bacterium]|nr:type II toxin-antitoxin system RelE/ParE family toxin [Saprospiraceae bacterium]